MTNIQQLLRWGQTNLSGSSVSSSLDAELLLCYILNCSRVFLYSHPEKVIDDESIQAFHRLIGTRKTGYPIAYLTGRKHFWSLELEVNEHTLIPRPETELLVELGLEKIKLIENPKIIDLGTGSGAIALAIANERPDAKIIAIDMSFSALCIAQKNQIHHQLDQVQFVCADWFDTIVQDEYFDLIVSNPPYIADCDPSLSSDIRFEPQQALSSGAQGLDDIKHIISEARTFLKPNGWLLLEHGYDQRDSIKSQFCNQNYKSICCWKDHAELDRVSGGQK